MQRRVVITGMGVISPSGLNLAEAWQGIKQGKSCASSLGEQYAHLPCRIAALIRDKDRVMGQFTKTESKTMSQSTAFALLAAREAIESSQLQDLDEKTKERVGVAMGTGMVDLEDICNTNSLLNKSYKQVSPFFVPRILPNMSAGHISMKWGFRGPNHTVTTACASGAHVIGDSFRLIKCNEADVMVCGAAEACISPLAIAGFCRLRALATSFNDKPEEASRPFDKAREGFVMAEGSAVLVLEELMHALERKAHIYAEILGYGMSGDASHLTSPHPEGLGARLAMQRAVGNAGIGADSVGYVNAHATSTPMGDAVEVKAIKSLFKGASVKVSSTKGAHGHLLGSAGNLETVFTVKAVEEGVFPPNVNLEEAEDEEVCFVGAVGEQWAGRGRRVALKNAFGFGGTNASLCIGQFLQ